MSLSMQEIVNLSDRLCLENLIFDKNDQNKTNNLAIVYRLHAWLAFKIGFGGG